MMMCAYDADRICNAKCVAYGKITSNKMRSPTTSKNIICKRGNFTI